MPLTFAPVDDAIRRAVEAAFSPAEPPVSGESPALALPHHVYTLAVADVRQNLWRPIGPVATRFLEVVGDRAVGAYEVSAGPDGTPQLTHRTLNSPYLMGTLEALAVAERLASGHEREFRLLRVPFLHLVAAWPHDPTCPESDRVVPILPNPLVTAVRQVWATDDLIGVLGGMVRDLEPPPIAD
jgi:hypothetical protein